MAVKKGVLLHSAGQRRKPLQNNIQANGRSMMAARWRDSTQGLSDLGSSHVAPR